MVAWIFGAAWLYLTTGAAFTRFAKLLNMPAFGYGLLAAVPFAAALAQLPVSYFITRYGHRKGIFITIGAIHRLLWLPIGAIPWLLPAGWQWQGLLVLVAVMSLAGQMTAPIWVSWMADMVPSRIRGRYFTRRGQLGQLTGVLVTLLVGYALDHAAPPVLLQVVCVALGISGLFGLVDFLFFCKVPDVQRVKPNPDVRIWAMLAAPLRDRNFRRFLGYSVMLTFSVGYIGQFAWLFIFDVARMSNTQANAMMVVMPLVIFIVSGPLWGRLLDRFGRKPILLIAGLAIVPGAIGWIFISREHWLWGYLCVVISTAAWPAIETGNFNILLNLSDGAGGPASGSAYVAINSAAGAVAGVLSGLFGGLVAQLLGDWRTMIFGYPLTYHGVLFIISSVLRLAALGWLIGFEDRHAASARTALRYLGTNLYSNLQQAVFIPGRVLQQLSRWTYQSTRRR